ncbi:hypothetical protein BD769DRAFT_1394773 [Suillus cothurnatus]|nr:hypothetical protein BD769DRAFT_1394773 [Suillus cothurnatus]
MNTTNDRLKSAGQEDDERRHNDGSKEKARMTVQTVMQCEQGERPSIGNAESESRRSLENEDHGGERSSSSRRRKRRWQEDDERRHDDGSREKACMTVQTVMQCEQGERPSIGNAESGSRKSLEDEDHGGERSSISGRRKRRLSEMQSPEVEIIT